MEKESNISLGGTVLESNSFIQHLKMLLKRSVHLDIERACNLKMNRRKHTPLYKRDTKLNQNGQMETTHRVCYINTLSCSINVNSSTIELTVHTSCYYMLDLLCVNITAASDLPMS